MEVLARLPETAQVALTKPPTYPRWGSKRNTGTRLGRLVAGPKRVGNTNLRSGRGCVSSMIDCTLELPTAARWRERRLKTGSSTTPRPLWGPKDRGNCSFVEVLCTTDREPSSGKKRNRTFSTLALLWGRHWCIHHFPKSILLHLQVTRLRASCFSTCRWVWQGPGRAGRCGAALLEAAAFAARLD